MLLRFTSCALNGPPLGIQDQSQSQSPPVAQAGFALEPLWAETGWTPEKFLGQHHWKFLPPEGPTFMGSSCHGSGFMVVNAP